MQILRIAVDLIPFSVLRYLLTERSSDPYAPRLLSRDTNILVEGFPRSANTFVYYYLQLSLPDARFAHHIHSWQQFLLSYIFRIPSYLIVRNPDATVSSFTTKRPDSSIAISYLEYAIFNSLSASLADRILFFEDVVDQKFIASIAENIGEELGMRPRPVEIGQVRALLRKRTAHKNTVTRPVDEGQFSVFARFSRRLAMRSYARACRLQASRVQP